ncbi:PH domain-containing protein [Nocardioides sp. R-C-SC26]|uniref:PH domain-containing protein n=1 Tax=Nocardioides sp. R-C-SC26 TaxID=2870414 RepID=UPI001E326191|nr:PH domain-containing protein [Nocardioides sp. R-C-SC26]
MPLPRTWRPIGPRIAGIASAAALTVIMALLWFGFDDETRAAVTPFQRGTVIAMFALGFSCLYAMARSRVEAREDGITVVNGFRRRELEWPQVVAAHLGRGAPWATLDLADGTTLSAMGIQSSDGARARTAISELRALVDR